MFKSINLDAAGERLKKKSKQKYNRYRDKLILGYLKKLRKRANKPLTMENKSQVLKDRERYRRLATAYWQTRLNNRPFVVPKPEYSRYWDEREQLLPGARKRWQDYVEKVWGNNG